ncbi:hypothetical protein T01_13496 [Trichinella spiralis]|uniref:Uncharacterized protein n=1 Tax=Trichinella spiralis TaxID=6334 RepID=A0A0V1BH08_TRISP|nr:hypothetical protein T01_13496 [Trichinella spiralis]
MESCAVLQASQELVPSALPCHCGIRISTVVCYIFIPLLNLPSDCMSLDVLDDEYFN